MTTTQTSSTYYCLRCHQLLPHEDVVFDPDSGSTIHSSQPILHGDVDDCGGPVQLADPSSSSPGAWNQLLTQQGTDAQLDQLSRVETSVLLTRLQWLEALELVVGTWLLTITNSPTITVLRDAELRRVVRELFESKPPTTKQKCPTCDLALLPSGLADNSLVCPLCGVRHLPTLTSPETK